MLGSISVSITNRELKLITDGQPQHDRNMALFDEVTQKKAELRKVEIDARDGAQKNLSSRGRGYHGLSCKECF
jgi:hypothetical protein